MTRFFVTIWLKKEDDDENKRRIADILEATIEENDIAIEEEIKISPKGNRVSFRGKMKTNAPEKSLDAFVSLIENRTQRSTRGRLLG